MARTNGEREGARTTLCHRLMYAYIASPLCSEAEKSFNLRLRDFLVECGFTCYLPQADGGSLSALVKQGVDDEETIRRRLFEADCAAIRRSDLVIACLDGRVPDEGLCIEVGMAFTLGIPCLAFKTDTRTAIRGRDNLMIEGCVASVARDWDQLREHLAEFTRRKQT